jgi:hypothetical protein
MTEELRRSVWIVYFILTVLFLIAIAIPFFDSKLLVYNHIPICKSKLNNETCIACGSSTSYYLLRNGDIIDAWMTNSFSVIVYFLSIVNGFLVFSFFMIPERFLNRISDTIKKKSSNFVITKHK